MCRYEDDPSYRDGTGMSAKYIYEHSPFGKCEYCGEPFMPNDERAEMVPKDKFVPVSEHLIVHSECYMSHKDKFDLA